MAWHSLATAWQQLGNSLATAWQNSDFPQPSVMTKRLIMELVRNSFYINIYLYLFIKLNFTCAFFIFIYFRIILRVPGKRGN
jgi:hypothetical protein